MLVFRTHSLVVGVAALGLLSGCSDSTAPRQSPAATGCSSTTPTQLASGSHVVIDPATTGNCVRLPAAASGARYLLMAFSGTGQVTAQGLEAPFLLSGKRAAQAASAQAATRIARSIPSPAERFHNMLRARGRELAATAVRGRAAQRPNFAMAPPVVGSTRSFQVCSSLNCTSFATVTATLRHVGPHNLLYLDKAAPPDGYTPAEISRLGSLFDGFMYPIDTTAFGRETDIDHNGAVIILLSPAVNQVSGTATPPRASPWASSTQAT